MRREGGGNQGFDPFVIHSKELRGNGHEQHNCKQQVGFRWEVRPGVGRRKYLSDQPGSVGWLKLCCADLRARCARRTEPGQLGLEGKEGCKQAQDQTDHAELPPAEEPTSHGSSLSSALSDGAPRISMRCSRFAQPHDHSGAGH